jgi:cytochrome c-type biogenesis protein CcmH
VRHWISAAAVVAVAAFLAGGCDRHVEPFDPGEQPEQPDLSKIFPEGAGSARPAMAELPPPPQQRGAPPLMPAAAPAAAPATEPAPPQPQAQVEVEPIRGTIRLAPELEDRVPPGGVLFIILRHGSAGPPLAVKRIPAPSFPLDFEIGAGDRMITSVPFAGPMQISARLDADGNVSRGPGDLAGDAAEGVEPGASDVALLLDRVL